MSPIGTGYVVTTLIGFTAIYSLLAVIDFGLMYKYGKLDPDSVDEHGHDKPTDGSGADEDAGRTDDDAGDRVPALIY